MIVVFCIVHQQRIDDLAHTQTVECEAEEREVLVVR